jgi:dipeptidyl aminopeptidase/acylaminoacyl peptidase
VGITMPLRSRQRRHILTTTVLVFLVIGTELKAQSLSPVTVADTITMTEIVGREAGIHDFLQLSPDGKHFAVTVQHGDISQNERVFSLLVFNMDGVLAKAAPDTVAVRRSSLNEDGIADVRWLDSDTLTFIGASEHNNLQVYAVDRRTKELRQLTEHPTNINAYAVAPGLERVIYTADADSRSDNSYSTLHGFTVTDQTFTDIMMGNLERHRLAARDLDYEVPQETFIRKLSSGEVVRILRGEGELVVVPTGLFPYSRNPISPDGRFAVVEGLVRPRASWRFFENPFPSTVAEAHEYMTTFVLVDLASGTSSLLIDAPSSPYVTSVVWAPDGRSVILVNMFQPLDTPNDSDRESRQKQTVVAEVELATRQVTVIHGPTLEAAAGQGVICAQALDWNRATNSLVLAVRKAPNNEGGTCDPNEVTSYRKTRRGWREIDVRGLDSVLRSSLDGRITISIDEGLNAPPNLKAVDHQTERSVVFTDLNPQFRQIKFAPVSVINWTAVDGTKWSGDLYTPPDAKPGIRYPLVIQTHGCTTDEFLINGFAGGTAYAAQVLANKEIVVLQEGQCGASKVDNRVAAPKAIYSSQYGEHSALGYESAIDFLDGKGLIDRARVGLQGHSATAWQVVYAVAHPHSEFRYAAVVSTARGDLGYFNYLASSYGRPWSIEGNGGPPLGEAFETFQRNALPFNLEHVTTPIMNQEPDGLRYVPFMWEIYEVLKLLGKPVEFIIFPQGTHNLVKPWERLTSQQAAVDWFCFWLKGEEDPDPARAEQYARWRELRKVQEANDAGAKAAAGK